MEISAARRAFSTQKSGAKRRGIEFNLTFKQWCDFWGEDIDRRGPGYDQLQMQRFADTGPYEIGNIRKGHPKQNTATFLKMKGKRDSENAALELQEKLNAAMFEDSRPEQDNPDGIEPEVFKLGMKSSYACRYNHAR